MKLEQALALAERFHDGATDKAGRPYLGHIQRVVAATTTDDEKLAAALHDLLLTYAHWDQEWLFDAASSTKSARPVRRDIPEDSGTDSRARVVVSDP